MVFYLTFQAYRNKNHNLIYINAVIEKFDKKAKDLKILVDKVKKYVWSIDKKVIEQPEDLLSLSYSCKTAIYIILFGDGSCFELSDCSFIATNLIFTNCYYRNIGVILETPYLIHKFVSPSTLMSIDFEGIHTSVKAETPLIIQCRC